MMEQLQTLQNNFNHKLNYLKQHAEWDRFTVAFLVKQMLVKVPLLNL